jgi:hypothetical protein
LSLCLTPYYEDVLGRRHKAPYTFLIFELNGGEQSDSCSSHSNPGETVPDIHSTEEWIGKENTHKPCMKIMSTELVHCQVHKKPTIEL